MGIVSTTKLAKCPLDMFVIMDGETFTFHGVTMQGNGDALVHLRYTDTGSHFDIEVAAQDMEELYWEA